MAEQVDLPSDVSDDNQMFTAEYKDGRLHIVEVSPYDKGGDTETSMVYEDGESILQELTNSDDGEQTKYLQLDLLNFTLLKNADGSNTYQMVSTDSVTENGDTITCVLSSDDVDDADNTESYVMLDAGEEQESYMYLQSAESTEQFEPTTTAVVDTPRPEPQPVPPQNAKETKQLTPIQILAKAKALRKGKILVSSASSLSVARTRKGRKKKSDLPTPIELLSSPNFRLYLYNCKLCTFKCNAVKEMTAHKKSEHADSLKNASASRSATLQCARCPYRGHTHRQLVNHISHSHTTDLAVSNEYITALQLDSEEVEAADVLVCGACGFESGDRVLFKKHIEDEHGAITKVP